jgi:CDP-diacylglycerol--serine O-phosphatidyltransferase
MKNIPNTITILNLLSGGVGVVAALNGFWYLAFWLMLAAAIFDFLDGMAARMLKAVSPIGKELDSLADLISFGFLPAAIMYRMFYSSPNLPYDNILPDFLPLIPFLGLLILASSALRLAIFNIDTRQKDYFIGLPTPANALFIGGYSLMFHFVCHCNALGEFLQSTYTLLGVTAFAVIMPLVPMRMLSLKFKNLDLKENVWRYVLIAGVLVLMIIFFYWMYMAVSLAILYYVILSMVWSFTRKTN